MTPEIALQLYTLRTQAQEDFEGMVRMVAGMGYIGVEPAGFPGTTPEAAGKLFSELGLKVPSAHTGLPLGDSKNEVLEAMAAIACPRLVTGKGPDDFNTLDKNPIVGGKTIVEGAFVRPVFMFFLGPVVAQLIGGGFGKILLSSLAAGGDAERLLFSWAAVTFGQVDQGSIRVFAYRRLDPNVRQEREGAHSGAAGNKFSTIQFHGVSC